MACVEGGVEGCDAGGIAGARVFQAGALTGIKDPASRAPGSSFERWRAVVPSFFRHGGRCQRRMFKAQAAFYSRCMNNEGALS
ncbi:MAG: hypothetical protein M9915_13720 [Rhizobacter sp.]|nr:hypothetical protein [Burkholderiaceae bacterium]MCO5124788.1 hypothetical protein [Rhizobacter sp.]